MAYNPMLPPWAQSPDTAYGDGPQVPPWEQQAMPQPPPGPAVPPWAGPPPGVAPELQGAPGAPMLPPDNGPPSRGQLADPFAPPSSKLIAPWDEKQVQAAGRVKGKDAAKAGGEAALGIVPRTEQAPEPQQSPMGEIRQGQEALLLDRGRIEAEAADRRSAMLTDAAYKSDDDIAAERDRVDQAMALRRDALQRFTSAAEKVAEMKEDPDRWWNEASTGKKMAAIGGGILAGFLNPGKPNEMVAIVEGQVDKDLAAQRTDMANARFGVEAQRTALGEMTQIFGDERAAFSYLRGQKKEQLAMQLEAEGAKSQSQLIMNNAAQGALALRESAIKDQQAAEQWAAEFGLNQYQAQTSRKQVGLGYANLALDKKQHEDAQVMGWHDRTMAAQNAMNERNAALLGGGNPNDIKKRQEIEMANREVMLTGADGKPLYGPDGSLLVAPTKEEAVKARQLVSVGISFRDAGREYARLMESYGTELFPSDGKQRMESLHAYLTGELKGESMMALGVLAGPDMGIIEKQIGDGTYGPTTRNQGARLRQTIDNYDKKIDKRLQGYGYAGSYTRDYDGALSTVNPGDTKQTVQRAPRGLAPPGAPSSWKPTTTQPAGPAPADGETEDTLNLLPSRRR